MRGTAFTEVNCIGTEPELLVCPGIIGNECGQQSDAHVICQGESLTIIMASHV